MSLRCRDAEHRHVEAEADQEAEAGAAAEGRADIPLSPGARLPQAGPDRTALRRLCASQRPLAAVHESLPQPRHAQ